MSHEALEKTGKGQEHESQRLVRGRGAAAQSGACGCGAVAERRIQLLPGAHRRTGGGGFVDKKRRLAATCRQEKARARPVEVGAVWTVPGRSRHEETAAPAHKFRAGISLSMGMGRFVAANQLPAKGRAKDVSGAAKASEFARRQRKSPARVALRRASALPGDGRNP
jgi:hypothetical protein